MSDEVTRFVIEPLGEDCAIISLGNVISEDVNRRAVSISEAVNSVGFEGFLEASPAYSSVAVYFDPRMTRAVEGTPFEAVRTQLEKIAAAAQPALGHNEALHDVPASFGGADGPDLDEVAERRGIRPEEVVEIFLSRNYRVFMLGFIPGFPYLGTLDRRIATSRRENPRPRVRAGSIGIAGSQTGIYPFDSPGGWQIIGRTDLSVFDPASDDPALFKPGDSARFVRVP